MSGILVNIDVPDVEAARQFYESGLGFSFRRALFGGTVAELTLGATRVYLIAHEAGSVAVKAADIRRDYRPHWTPVHLDITVEDIDAAVERALAAGASRDGEQTVAAWGRLAPLRDPFGHGVCVIEFSELGYDAV